MASKAMWLVVTYLTVQDVVVAVTRDGHLDICSITRRNLGLCHQESRSDLALQQRVKPLPLLCLGAVLGNDLHVTSVWGSAVGSLSNVSAMSVSIGVVVVPQKLSCSCPGTLP